MARPTAKYAVTAEDKTKAGLNSVKRSLGGLRAPFAAFAVASGAVFVAFTKSAFAAADELNKLDTQLGFSTEALSQYQFVAKQTGVEFTALTTGLQRMVRRVGEAAQGTGEAKNALFELGVDAKRLAQLKPDQQFEVLADAFARVSNQGDKVRLAFKLFDTEGVKLLRTMEGGSEAVRELREEFARMGGTLDKDVAQTATETVDAMGRLRATFSAASVEIIRIFGPAITAVANWLSDTIPKAVRETERALLAARIGFVNLAASVAELFGGDEAAENLRDLGRVYSDIFDDVSRPIDEFSATLGEAVNANDFFDDSLKKLSATKKKDTAAQKALNKELALAKTITDNARSPFEQYSDTLTQLQTLLDSTNISQETFNRAAAEARVTFLGGLGIDPTPLQEYEAGLKALREEFAALNITQEEYGRGRVALEDALVGGIDKVPDKLEKTRTALESFGDGAAKSIQASFSEFFFDPFGTETDSLVSNFATAMRRVAAEVLANQALQFLTATAGGSSLFGGLFGRALGGPVGVNTPSIVGERGPELLLNAPPGSQVSPNAGGSVTVNVTASQNVTRDSASQIGYTLGRQINDSMRRNR